MAKKKRKTQKKVTGRPNYISLGIGAILLLNIAGVLTYSNIAKVKALSVQATPQAQVMNASTESAAVEATPSPTETPQPLAPPATSYTGVHVPIVYYHYIGNNPNPKDTARNTLEVTPDKFEEQMNYLQNNGFTPISPETLYAVFNKTASVTKPIMLTFDDGYEDFYSNAFPILRKHGFHSVSFIPTGLIGTGYYMNWGQIKEIQSSGLVSFEDHSIHHSNLPSLSYDGVMTELKESKATLESQIGKPVNFVAYPYGASNNLVLSIAQKIGYIGGFGTWGAQATGPGFNMPRIRITGQMSTADFASRI